MDYTCLLLPKYIAKEPDLPQSQQQLHHMICQWSWFCQFCHWLEAAETQTQYHQGGGQDHMLSTTSQSLSYTPPSFSWWFQDRMETEWNSGSDKGAGEHPLCKLHYWHLPTALAMFTMTPLPLLGLVATVTITRSTHTVMNHWGCWTSHCIDYIIYS